MKNNVLFLLLLIPCFSFGQSWCCMDSTFYYDPAPVSAYSAALIERDTIQGKEICLYEFTGLRKNGSVVWCTAVNGSLFPLIGGFDYFPALNSWTYISKKDRKRINAIWSKGLAVSSK